MPICGIYGCSNRPGVNREFSYYKVPKIINDQGESTRNLSEERRRLWKASVNRKDITTEEKWERTIVCSRHFVGGKKAYLHDRTNPAWIPTLHLGLESDSPSTDKGNRFQRASQRKEKKKVADAVSSLMSLKKRRIDFSTVSTSSSSENEIVKCNEDDTNSHETISNATTEQESECYGIPVAQCTFLDSNTQTDLIADNIKQLENDLKARISEEQCTDFLSKCLYSFEYYEKNPDKVAFYTGLSNIALLKVVYNLIESYLPNDNKCLSKENAFFVCILRMRMNYLLFDMANQLCVSPSTVQRSFHDTLNVLYDRLKFLVRWPERENLRRSMPMCFRENWGEKVVVVFDCFELFIETPSGAANRVYTYSNYKHHHTVKYLIGTAPQGVVTFISEGWGGRTSDKYLTEKCNVLENLLPGDIVMVDRGFTIGDSVNFYRAELAIPGFTKGQKQLHPVEVEKTRKIANVRIHVERVIGHILRKFRIFDATIPMEFLHLRKGQIVPTIDKLVFVACALTNLCPSIVPFE